MQAIYLVDRGHNRNGRLSKLLPAEVGSTLLFLVHRSAFMSILLLRPPQDLDSSIGPVRRLAVLTVERDAPTHSVYAIFGILLIVVFIVLAAKYMSTKDQKWLGAFALLGMLVVYSVAFGVAIFKKEIGPPVIVIASTVVALIIGAYVLADPKENTVGYRVRERLGLFFRHHYVNQVIDEGRTILPESAKKLTGPRKLVIKSNNAVLISQDDRIELTVHGPGEVELKRKEYVKQVIDLRPRHTWLTLQMLSGDQARLEVKAYARYEIAISEGARLHPGKLTQSEKDILSQLMSSKSDWEVLATTATEAAIRQLFGSHDSSELFEHVTYRHFGRRIVHLAQEECPDKGIRISAALIQDVKLVS